MQTAKLLDEESGQRLSLGTWPIRKVIASSEAAWRPPVPAHYPPDVRPVDQNGQFLFYDEKLELSGDAGASLWIAVVEDASGWYLGIGWRATAPESGGQRQMPSVQSTAFESPAESLRSKISDVEEQIRDHAKGLEKEPGREGKAQFQTLRKWVDEAAHSPKSFLIKHQA